MLLQERPMPAEFLQAESYLSVGDFLRNFQNIPILISNKFEEIFVFLNKTIFYDIAVFGRGQREERFCQ